MENTQCHALGRASLWLELKRLLSSLSWRPPTFSSCRPRRWCHERPPRKRSLDASDLWPFAFIKNILSLLGTTERERDSAVFWPRWRHRRRRDGYRLFSLPLFTFYVIYTCFPLSQFCKEVTRNCVCVCVKDNLWLFPVTAAVQLVVCHLNHLLSELSLCTPQLLTLTKTFSRDMWVWQCLCKAEDMLII